MRRDYTLPGAVLFRSRESEASADHEIQHPQQPSRSLDIILITRVVEGDEDFVGQAPGILWFVGRTKSRPPPMLLIHASLPTVFRNRTPAPPPFSGMNSTPAA
jgi:hypothetical protein